jgi:putative transcriptional regulator
MINHHPKFELLKSYVDGDLPASIAAGINIHIGLCSKCQQQVNALTEQVAEFSFEDLDNESLGLADADMLDSIFDIDKMTSETDVIQYQVKSETQSVRFKDNNYELPRVLNNMEIGGTTNLGKLARSRVLLEEGEIHTSLLHIEPGGSVPQHTHNGFEITVLLDGSFCDDSGEYVKGDFIMLDGNHEHQPISKEGCLCYTVVNDSLHFTQGFNKLLNPIGSLIY